MNSGNPSGNASAKAAANTVSNAVSNADESVDFGFKTVEREQKRRLVGAVFDSVAGKYDVMNDLMSLGVHRLWKRDFVEALGPLPNRKLLDLAGGTGDISAGWLQRGGGPAILSDINLSMLSVGRDRMIEAGLIAETALLVTDAEALPLPDGTVDRVSIAFGLRNCTNKSARVGGGAPRIASGRQIHVPRILQAAGLGLRENLRCLVLQGDAADRPDGGEGRRQLPVSGREHPHVSRPGALADMMRGAGLEKVTFRNLSGGIAAIHQGWRL